MTQEALDLETLKSWIGREETAQDVVEPRLARSFEATLDRPTQQFEAGEEAPLAIHWCLAPAIVPTSETGSDGHPARGGFLPPVPLPRRMWAGGQIRQHDPLRIGDTVNRLSRIEDVEVKEGRSGTLCFVTVHHEVTTERGVSIEERQDIVYRGEASAASKPASAPAGPQPADHTRKMTAGPVLLFRYSALTFNGHRIHYDADYCRDVEGYPGLVVHGPLQATLLLRFAQEIAGVMPASFSYRGLSPLFGGEELTLKANEADDGMELWIEKAGGNVTMKAEVNF